MGPACFRTPYPLLLARKARLFPENRKRNHLKFPHDYQLSAFAFALGDPSPSPMTMHGINFAFPSPGIV